MKVEDMIDLVDELNDLSIENEENPFITSTDWPFEFFSNGYFAGIRFNGREMTCNFDEEGRRATKREVIEETLNELESWLPALQSAIWALGKALEKEKGVKIEGNA